MLRTSEIAGSVLYFEELDSTNTYCRLHGAELSHGTLVIAENQTAGRGSRGRTWEAPENESLFMSLVLKPDMSPVFAPRLTLVMALSCARAFQQYGIDVQIKWPNDIVLNGKKLVGILTEMNAKPSGIEQVVVGIGINVLTGQFPKEIAYKATSLWLETGKHFSREEIAAAVMNCFEEDYETFLKTCDLSELLEQYRQFSATVGQKVQILDGKDGYTGFAYDVDKEGQLWVRTEDGQEVKVFADEVSVRGIYGYV